MQPSSSCGARAGLSKDKDKKEEGELKSMIAIAKPAYRQRYLLIDQQNFRMCGQTQLLSPRSPGDAPC